MTAFSKNDSPSPKIDPESLFKKLGLAAADERPIMHAWRKANADWRRARLAQMATHANRVADHVRRYQRRSGSPGSISKNTKGRAKAVWCIELGRKFSSMSEAARFVKKKPSNISQALRRGGRCGPYHWEAVEH